MTGSMQNAGCWCLGEYVYIGGAAERDESKPQSKSPLLQKKSDFGKTKWSVVDKLRLVHKPRFSKQASVLLLLLLIS